MLAVKYKTMRGAGVGVGADVIWLCRICSICDRDVIIWRVPPPWPPRARDRIDDIGDEHAPFWGDWRRRLPSSDPGMKGERRAA